MAGAGYRTWTAGEVVTASNVQSYLQDQTVGVYAGTAARSSAILSPSEGQVSYRTDDDIVEVYDGTAWQPIAPPDTSGLIHIKTESFSAVSSVSVNDVFSAEYTNYKILTNAIHSTAEVAFNLRFRVSGTDNTSTNYRRQSIFASSTTVSGSRQTGQTAWNSGLGIINQTNQQFMVLEVGSPFESVHTTGYSNTGSLATGNITYDIYAYGLDVTTSYTGFTAFVASGTVTGSISVYGYKK